MYCQQCGKEVADQAQFCPNCGARQAQPTASDRSAEARQDLLNLLDRVRATALQCEPQYQRYNQLEAEIVRWNARRTTYKGWRALFFIGLPVAVLLVPFMVSFFFAGIAGIDYGSAESIIGGFSMASLCFLLIVGWFVGSLLLRKSCRRKQRRDTELAREEIRRRREEQLRVTEQLDEIYRQSELDDLFPQQYLYVGAVDECAQLVRNRRADTLKEALNLYEQELHQMRLEAGLRDQYNTLLAAQSAQQRTAKAATFAAVMAGIGVINSLRR